MNNNNNEEKSFGSGTENSDASSTRAEAPASPPSGFSKFKPEEQMPNFEKSAFYQARQSGLENLTGSDRKRNRRALDENSLDDILGQLTSKLNTLSTSEDEKQLECINAFIDVLGCSKSESEFYLASAAWNLEQAVLLWLDSNTYSSGSGSRNHNDASGASYGSNFGAGIVRGDSLAVYSSTGFNKKYRHREVQIEGLPGDWRAWVNSDSGTIQFEHIASGFIQNNVPPGYAEIEQDESDMNMKVSSGERVFGSRRRNRNKSKTVRTGFEEVFDLSGEEDEGDSSELHGDEEEDEEREDEEREEDEEMRDAEEESGEDNGDSQNVQFGTMSSNQEDTQDADL